MTRDKEGVTVSNIVAVAGVSKATVSRYIDSKSELMTFKIKERILSFLGEKHSAREM